jgi:hypothetical protein
MVPNREGREPTPLELELRGERAASLGRSGRRLRSALEALRRCDERQDDETPSRETGRSALDRSDLLASAAEALLSYIVQREALGLTSHADAIRDYQVPREVLRRVGITRAR